MSTTPSKDQVQGEGDYEAGRRYDKASREFAESGRVEPAAHDAAPESEQEAEQLERAEQEGKSHSKGEGPLTSRAAQGLRFRERWRAGGVSASRQTRRSRPWPRTPRSPAQSTASASTSAPGPGAESRRWCERGWRTRRRSGWRPASSLDR